MPAKFPISVLQDVHTYQVEWADELAELMSDTEFTDRVKRMNALKEKAKNTALHGGVLLNESGVAVIRVDASGTMNRFNSTLFKVEHAKLHAEYMEESVVRKVGLV